MHCTKQAAIKAVKDDVIGYVKKHAISTIVDLLAEWSKWFDSFISLVFNLNCFLLKLTLKFIFIGKYIWFNRIYIFSQTNIQA